MSASSNPGAATPESLHQMYAKRAAATANPWVLRDVRAVQQLTTSSLTGPAKLGGTSGGTMQRLGEEAGRAQQAEHQALLIQKAVNDARGAKKVGSLTVVAGRRNTSLPSSTTGITLSLNSLDMTAQKRGQ